jgi:hypothetical protein
MGRLRILPVSLAVLFLTLGNAHTQYVYVKHPEVLVKQGATTAVLPCESASRVRLLRNRKSRQGRAACAFCRDNGRRYNRCGHTLSRSPTAALGEHRRSLGFFGSDSPDFMH